MRNFKAIGLTVFIAIASLTKVYAQCNKPIIVTQPISATSCTGGSASLSVSATGGSSYQWYWAGSSGSGTIPPTYPWSGATSSTLILSLVNTSTIGQYWVKITNSCGVTTSNTVTITISNPSLTPTSSPGCVGGTIGLVPGASGSNYSWTGPNGFSSTSASPALVNVTPAMAGVYTVTITNSSGCSTSGSTTVTVNPAPSFTVSSNAPACLGGPVNLAGPSGMLSYSWSGPNGFTSSAQSPLVSSNANELVAGTYTLTAASISGSGCSGTASTVVTVNAVPVITAQPISITSCTGGSASLSVSATGGSSYQWYWAGSSGSGIVPLTYPWSGTTSNTLILSLVNTSTIGQYWVKITNSCGFTTSNTVTIAASTSSVTPTSSSACVGGTIGLIPGASGSSYSWTGPNGFSSINASPALVNVTPEMAGVYTLTVINSSGCSSSGSTTVIVNPAPSFTVSNNAPICLGGQVNLTSPSGMLSYSWTGPNGFTSSVQSPLVSSNADQLISGTYTLTAASISGSGCSGTASTVIIINTIPIITVQPISVAVCAGSPTAFNITALGATSYQWYWNDSGEKIIPPTYPFSGYTSNVLSLALTSDGLARQYWVKASNSCGSITSNVATVVLIKPSVSASNTGLACLGNSIGLLGTGTGTYSWFGPNGFTSTAKSPLVSNNADASMAGVYTLTLTSADGCTNTANTEVTVKLTNCDPYNYVTTTNVIRDNVFSKEEVAGLVIGDRTQSTVYFDGLGRTVQAVMMQESPLKNDVVQHVAYDQFARENMKFLPYTSLETNGKYKGNAKVLQADFYNVQGDIARDGMPFVETIFEPSPLNRVLKQGAPVPLGNPMQMCIPWQITQ